MNIMIFTNNNTVKLESDDRRYAILDVSSGRVGDRIYFKELNEFIKKKNDMVARVVLLEMS